MAKITLQTIKHSYSSSPNEEAEFALKEVNTEWSDGGAYALLGPSGCGKTTLLNIISGLLTPTHGSVIFNDSDVTQIPTSQREIAQVFQFPVVYDTMSVFDNLAFPLRNRGVDDATIKARVSEVARMLDLDNSLQKRAAGLTADGKQKISLGRGLVREDVNAILFDEPLTVIDPHLKWLLRSKLKELHQQLGTTMIYVTHDQTEALTFADRVVVMYEGTVVQVGTPIELFERPEHTFVGHFIGSPGMNVLPCAIDSGVAYFGGVAVDTASNTADLRTNVGFQLGVRPEFVEFSDHGIPVELIKVDDLGRHRVVVARHDQATIKMIVDEDVEIPADNPKISFNGEYTRLYAGGWLVA